MDVTNRGVIDPLRKCHLRCDFCYYLHSDLESVQPWPVVQAAVDEAVKRKDTHVDITGGEPLLYPDIVDLVAYALERNIRSRIISSLVAAPAVVENVIRAGLDDWLISMHGATAETHNAIVHVDKARSIQEKRLSSIINHSQFDRGICFNYVMISRNQHEIADFAQYVLRWRPRVVNFINFNPHYEWATRGGDVVCDLRITGPQLDQAIELLEDNDVGVNVRYFPMCHLEERHRKNVCNDLHVAFDSGEWSNGIENKDYQTAYNYGVNLSNAIEEKNSPCSQCSHQWTCGGANKAWHAASNQRYGELLVPLTTTVLSFDHYRKYNIKGMA